MTLKPPRIGLALVLAAAACLLFFRLGGYVLWDDEAAQALLAEQVWHTGDTSAVIGRNIVAYNQGAELRGLHDRANPPLPAYVLAPFLGLGGSNAFWARLPSALCGVAFFALLLQWLAAEVTDPPTLVLFCLALLGNVSLFLYFREARYYGIVLLCSLGIARLYFSRPRTPGKMVGISLLLACVLASHYMTYVAIGAVLAVDYFCWHSRAGRLTPDEWRALLLPQSIVGLFVASTWNPFLLRVGGDEFANSFRERLELFWWNLRDLNRNEFGPGVLLLLAVGLAVCGPAGSLLRRGCVALGVYCGVLALVSPKVVRLSPPFADVRYLLPLLPLYVALAVWTLRRAVGRRVWLAVLAGGLAFGTNLLNFGPLLPEGFRSTLWAYVGELRERSLGSYGYTAGWMRENMPPGASVWVSPSYAVYPLLFQDREFVYAWQLHFPPERQFADLDPINFFGRLPPDYVVAFGPYRPGAEALMANGRNLGFDYQPVAVIRRYWDAVHRPELTDHQFRTYRNFDPSREAIYIYRRMDHLPAGER